MTPGRSPTVFWCSTCKERHAGECPPAAAAEEAKDDEPREGETLRQYRARSLTGVYLLKGQTSLKYDPAMHGSFDKLIADGYRVYDPMSPPGDDCYATIKTHVGPPCRHGYSWQCPRVPRPKRAP